MRQHSPARFYRDTEHSMIMGVCAGIADYFGISRGLVRLGAVVILFFFHLIAIVGYLILGFVLKPKPLDLYASTEDEEFWRHTRVDPKGTTSDIQARFRELERRIRDAEAFVTSSEFRLRRDFSKL